MHQVFLAHKNLELYMSSQVTVNEQRSDAMQVHTKE